MRIARRQRARFVGRNSAAFAVRAAQKTVGRTAQLRRPQHLVEVDSQMGNARAEPVCRRRARFAQAFLRGGAILAFVEIRQARLGRRTETKGRVRPKTEQQHQGGPKNWQRLEQIHLGGRLFVAYAGTVAHVMRKSYEPSAGAMLQRALSPQRS